MSLNLTLNRDTKLALYRQIAEQIKTQIGNGRLPANTRLPTVRKLAQELSVTRLTIQNAYSELQADGWIEATVGRGTYVSPSVQRMSLQPTIGQYLTPDSVLGDMLEINQIVGVRSMAMAHPDPALFPTDEFWEHLNRLRPHAAQLFTYGPIQGDTELRVQIANLLNEQQIDVVPEDIIVTAGTMQGINLIVKAITEPNDTVLVDEPTFLGMLNILKAQRINWHYIAMDEKGPDLDALENALQKYRPRFYYTIPNFHNPTGISISEERRFAILNLAEKYDCTIIEDNIYGSISYDKPAPLPLKALDKSGRVLYLSGFSKALMPGLRIGYLVTPPHMRTRLLTLRRSTDLCSPDLTQRALAHFLQDGGLKRHLKRVIPAYKERRDTLMESLSLNMPKTVQWTYPAGGFSSWVTLPYYFDRGELYQVALHNGFAFTPGEAYLLEDPQHDHLRLCFGNQSTAGIRSGIRLLADLIKQRITEGKQPSSWIPVV